MSRSIKKCTRLFHVVPLIAIFILSVAYFVTGTEANAATYYVDSTIADTHPALSAPDCTTYDPATFACSGGASSAYKTIADVNAGSFSPDDKILFRKGQTWREQLTVPSSGSSGHPITFGAYGTGANPLINGATLVTSWADNSLPQGSIGDLLSTNFDSGTLAGNGYSVTGSSTLSSVQAYTTTKSCLFAAGTNYIQHSITASSELYLRAYIYVSVLPSSDDALINLYNGGARRFTLYMKSNGILSYWNDAVGTGGDTSYTLPTGGWHYIELHWKMGSGTSGAWEIKVDGSNVITVAATNTGTSNIDTLRFGQINGATGGTIYMDNLDVSSTNWLGAISLGGPANTWVATLAGQPEQISPFQWQIPAKVWFDGTLGTQVGSVAACDGPGKWYWSGNKLYTYGAVDPSATYSSPGIEAANNNGIYIQRDYITIDGLDVTKADHGLFVDTTNGVARTNITVQNGTFSYNGASGIEMTGTQLITNCLIQDNVAHHNGGSGIYGSELTNCLIRRNVVSYNGDYQFWVGGIRLFYEGSTAGGNIIEHNESHHNTTPAVSRNGWSGGGDGIHLDTVYDGDIVRYNRVHDNAESGLHDETPQTSGDAGGTKWYYNLSYNNGGYGGMLIARYSNSPATNKASYIYNNVFYGNTYGVYIYGDGGGRCSNNVIENNLLTGNTTYQLSAGGGAENDGVNGSGNLYSYNDFGTPTAGKFVSWGGVDKNTIVAVNALTGVTNNSAVDPLFVSTSTSNFTPQSSSPAIDVGANLGTTYQLGLDPASTWPSNVLTLNQNSNGSGWEIGAYVYQSTSTPTVSITAPTASAVVSGSGISVTATATTSSPATISSVQFTLDGSNLGVADTSSPYSAVWDTTTGVSDGSHILRAVATDNYGNAATSSPITVTVDNTGPTGSISNGGGSPTNDATPTLNLTIADAGIGTAGAQMRFSCDNASWSSWEEYATPKTDFNIRTGAGCTDSDGSKIVYLQFKDSLGNVGSSYNTGAFTLDTTASFATLSNTPASLTASITALIIVAGTDITAYEYKLDAGTYGAETPVATPISLSSLADGSHTISVIGKDSSDNWQDKGSATTYTWTVDTTAPIVTFSIPTTSNALSVTFTSFSATDANGVTGYLVNETSTTPSLSDSGWAATAATSYTFASEGVKTVYSWARDEGGNISAAGTGSVTVTLSLSTLARPVSIGGGGPLLNRGTRGRTAVATSSRSASFAPTVGNNISTTATSSSTSDTAPSTCTISASSSSTFTPFVNLLISLGIIPPDRATFACQALARTPAAPESVRLFTKPLAFGMTDPDVKRLQVFLNAHGFIIAQNGLGAPGQETDYYGAKTSIAVAAFQEAYKDDILTPSGLTRGSGYFGMATTKKVNALLQP